MKENQGIVGSLQACPSLLSSILSNTRDAILVTDAWPIDKPGPRIVYANESFTRMTGYTFEELEGKTPRILQGPETDRARLDEIRIALTQRRPVRVELLNYRKDGSEFWVEVDIVPITNEYGNDTHWVSVQRETTERRKREEALKESEERLRAILVQYASDMITILEPDGTIRYQSPAVELVLDYEPEELVGKNILDYVHPEDADRAVTELVRVRERPEVRGPLELRFRHKDGSWRYLEGLANNLINDPVVEGVVINSRDVTGRKRSEEQLKSAEERYRTLVEQVPAIIYIHEPTPTHQSTTYDYEVSYISPRVEEILGYSSHEFLQNRTLWNEIIHPGDLDEVLREDERTDGSGDPFSMEYRMVHRDGSVVWIKEEAFLICDVDGEPLYWQGVMTVVTEQKLAEEASRRSEAKFQSVVQNSSEVVKIMDVDGTLKYASPAFERIFGYDLRKAVGTNVLDYVHPDDLPRIQKETEKALEGPGVTSNVVEYRFQHANGSWRWVESIGTYLLDDPNVEGVVVNVRDVTERKKTEEQLKSAEERYRTLVEQIPAAIYIQKPTLGQVTSYDTSYMSPRIEEILGYPPERFIESQNFWYGVIHSEDLPDVAAEDRRTDETGDPFSMEYRMISGDGSVVWVKEEALLIHNSEGEASYWQGVMRDVTVRRQAQDDLRNSEERFRSLVQNASDLITVVDAGGIITYESPSKERVLGYGPQELVGRPILEHVHLDDLQHVSVEFTNIISHPGYVSEKPVEFWYRHADGTWRYLESLAVNLLDDPGVGSIVITSREVTDRKKLEEQLYYQAFHDPLTGLPNRSSLQRDFEKATSYPTARPYDYNDPPGEPSDNLQDGMLYVGILFLDLDGFKKVNDSMGHETGDKLLQAVAERLKGVMRAGNSVARLGGDEFCVLLTVISDSAEAIQIAERLKTSLELPFSIPTGVPLGNTGTNYSRFSLSASIGIAVGKLYGSRSLDELLREADAAMYRTKKRGDGLYEIVELEEDSG